MNAGFATLKAKRERLRSSLRENEADLESILVGIYSNPAHFLYELVQNAEDEGASFVEFDLRDDVLVVHHDGKPFTLDDVRDITKLGLSGKSTELTKLGRFGVGFKSVFAVTKSPRVHSGLYCFRIEDLVVPVPEVPNDSEVGDATTTITLPFDHDTRTSEKAHSLTLNRLMSFGSDALLFLKNVEKIRWRSPNGSGEYRRTEHPVAEDPYMHRVEIASYTDEGESEAKLDRSVFLRISQTVTVGKGHRSVEVAYTLEINENGEERIVPDPNTPLYVFFPTEKNTLLNFRVQGPFRTTPNRENVPLDDADNKQLLHVAANLVARSIGLIKQLGLLRVETFDVWPLELTGGEGEMYGEVRKSVLRCIESERVLPTATGSFATAAESVLVGSPELPSLLTKKDLQNLYERRAWLHTSITHRRSRALYNTLRDEMEVPEIHFDGFVRKIDVSFFKQKNDQWLIRFYSALRTQRALWQGYQTPLKHKPFIRIEDGSHVAPFDRRDQPLVYLPATSSTGFAVVRRSISRNKEARDFLEQLGLTEPDVLADVRENILPKYRKGSDVPPDYYVRDFETIKTAFKGATDSEKRNLLNDLRHLKIVAATGPEGIRLRQPGEVYLPTSVLQLYFASIPTTSFVAPLLNEISGVNEFLERLGVSGTPRRVPILTELSEEETWRMREGKRAVREEIEDYDLDGLEDFFFHLITVERSTALWSILLNGQQATGYYGDSYYRATYSFILRTRKRNSYFDAHFLKVLRTTPWLYDQNGDPVTPGEITLRQLADNYETEDVGSRLLIEKLNFLPNIIDDFSPEQRTRFELAMTIPLEELVAMSQKQNEAGTAGEEDKGDSFADSVPPGEVEVKITEFDGENNERTPGKTRHSGGDTTSPKNAPKRDPETGRKRDIPDVEVGLWGEVHVAEYLQAECNRLGRQLQRLNEEGWQGEGCDFIVLEGEEPIEYVEVKTTRESGTVVVHLSSAQWASARTLDENEEGEKYVLYIVRKAGTPEASIQIVRNPVGSWREGRLHATPVDLVIPATE